MLLQLRLFTYILRYAAEGTVSASVPCNLTQGDTNTVDKRKRTSSRGCSKPARVISGAGLAGRGKVSPVELSCSSVSDDLHHEFKGDMVLTDYLCVNKRKRDDSLVTDTEQSSKLSRLDRDNDRYDRVCQKTLSLTHPKYHSGRALNGSLQVKADPVVSVRERVEQMEWRESQVESGGVSKTSGERGVSGERVGVSSKLERKESGEGGVASGERVGESSKSSEGGEGSGVRHVFGLKCKPTILSSLQPPKFLKDPPMRPNLYSSASKVKVKLHKRKDCQKPKLHSSASKSKLHKPKDSKISSNLQFWEKWLVKTGSNPTPVLTKPVQDNQL